MSHVPNSELTTGRIPSPDRASGEEMIAFANAFDGYEVWGGLRPVQTVTYSVRDAYERDDDWPDSVTVLRTALFGEARSEKFVDYGGPGDDPEGWRQHRTYMGRILRQIKQGVGSTEQEDERRAAVRWLQSHPSPPLELDSDEASPLSEEEVALAVRLLADALRCDHEDGLPPSERALRDHLVWAVAHTSGAVVEPERRVHIPEFQGVGPVDVVTRAGAGGPITGMLECKWSRDEKRDKIYEAAWDAIKLSLASLHNPAAGGFLITAATETAWSHTETGDLFTTGEIQSRELWGRSLTSPGVNGGETVGNDCEAGGRGNVFTHAPERLIITHITDAEIPGTNWVIKAAQVRADGELVAFASAPEFPALVNQAWLERHVPTMPRDEFARLLGWLAHKRWTDQDLRERVHPLLAPRLTIPQGFEGPGSGAHSHPDVFDPLTAAQRRHWHRELSDGGASKALVGAGLAGMRAPASTTARPGGRCLSREALAARRGAS